MATLAEHTPEGDRFPVATVMEARDGGESYWFIFNSEHGLEVVIPFDRVEFKHYSGTGGTDPEKIRTVAFYRRDPRRPDIKTGSIEGGRGSWGDDVIDTLGEV